MTRREKDAERKRRQRASETPEEREKRNEKDRLYARRKRSSEGSDASLEPLRKQQMINRTRRNNETTDERTVCLRSDSERFSAIARWKNEVIHKKHHGQHLFFKKLKKTDSANLIKRCRWIVYENRCA